MKILVDTNVLIDSVTQRMPYAKDADRILKLCQEGKLMGVVTSNSILDTFYVTRKEATASVRREILSGLCGLLEVVSINEENLKMALQWQDFADLEDCVQYLCAKQVGADYIITRNEKDFTESDIPAVMPKKFLNEIIK